MTVTAVLPGFRFEAPDAVPKAPACPEFLAEKPELSAAWSALRPPD
jgi:hypothetical protein